MASFSISYTDTSVTVSISGLSKGQIVRVYVRKDPDPGYSASDKTYTATSASMKKRVSGLSPETDYACNVNVDGDWLGAEYFTTEPSAIQIDEWSWTSSNGTASDAQTKAAYYAVTEQGEVGAFSYLVWNDMVDKVYEILEATDGDWDAEYATYSKTKMSSTSKTLTAKRFNSLRLNVEQRYSTGIDEVSRGDIVYGWYFTTLTKYINKWIEKI